MAVFDGSGTSYVGLYKWLVAVARKSDSYPDKPREHRSVLDMFVGELDGVPRKCDNDPHQGKVALRSEDTIRHYDVTADLSGPQVVVEEKWNDYYDLLGIREYYSRKFTDDGSDSLRVEETETDVRMRCGLGGRDIAGIMVHNPGVRIADLLKSSPPQTKTTVFLVNKETGTVTHID